VFLLREEGGIKVPIPAFATNDFFNRNHLHAPVDFTLWPKEGADFIEAEKPILVRRQNMKYSGEKLSGTSLIKVRLRLNIDCTSTIDGRPPIRGGRSSLKLWFCRILTCALR
jgi:hypothetical protein